MKKKFLLVLTIITFAITIIYTISASAENVNCGKCGTNLTWELDTDGTLTISGNGRMYYYNIFNNYYAPWYDLRNDIKKVIIENGVKDITNYAFYDCNRISYVDIPDSITNIGKSAFESCSSLRSMIIPNSVTSIGEYAFAGSGLQTIKLGKNVKSIGSGAFGFTNYLQSLYISDIAAYLNCVYTDGYSIPTYTGGLEIYLNDSLLTDLVIPEGVNRIPAYAFYGCDSLTSVVIPDSVTEIGYSAFMECSNLVDVIIPNFVETVGGRAFYECSSLKSVSIGKNVTTIGVQAFDGCYVLTEIFWNAKNVSDFSSYSYVFWAAGVSGDGISVIFGEGVERIPDYVFYTDWERRPPKIISVTISASVNSIGYYAFGRCENLNEVNYAGTMEQWQNITLGAYNSPLEVAYKNSEFLKSITYEIINEEVTITNCDINLSGDITIPSTIEGCLVTSIGNWAFNDCQSITSVTLPYTIESIGEYAFHHCIDLSNVYIPNGVVSIGEGAFIACGLTSVTIPESVEFIGDRAFDICYYISDITVDSNNMYYLSIDGVLYNKDKTILMQYAAAKPNAFFEIPNGVIQIADSAFGDCINLTEIVFPDSVKTIGKSAFYYCENLETLTMFEGVENIKIKAFHGCKKLKTVFLNGNQVAWEKTIISAGNDYLKDATIKYFYYVYFIDECENKSIKTKHNIGSLVDFSDIDEVNGYTIQFYTDEAYEEPFDISTPVNENITIYLKYVPKQYISRFVNYDGSVIWEGAFDYGTEIMSPEEPTRERTQQYTYTFTGWSGFTEGITQQSKEMVFVAEYETTLNQYLYRFVDADKTVLKEVIADYGTVIIPPESPDDNDPYTFDYWHGYTDGRTLTENVSFSAVYKYKDYSLIVDGLSDAIMVTYNSNYSIKPQTKESYAFIGYFTEKNGAGIRITNEKGESIDVYNIVGNLNVYPHFESIYMNKVELQGTFSAMPGDTITQKAIFATDKNASYFIATVKYPKHFNFKSIKGVDFKEATKDSEKVVGDYKYLDITCIFDYEGNFAETNTYCIPFEIEFDVATDAPIGKAEISIEDVELIGEDTFDITDVKNHIITILPKLAENIEIVGSTEIDNATQFTTVVSPDYTTDKSVIWSLNDETIATISQDGTVTPVKNGTVIITATAKDRSEVFATKTVNVIAYAKINSLDFNGGVVLTEFKPETRKYTVYVKEDATSISLKPTFSGGGVLRPNGSGIWISGRSKDFEINDTITTITLNRDNVPDMTNSVYTIEVVKYEGTKTEVSEDKKSFTITPINIENGKTVILALYNGEQFVEMQSAVYSGEAVPFTTTKSYTKAKVMVWNDLTSLKPVCEIENVQ